MNRAYKFPNEPATCSRTLRASDPFEASNGHPRFALIYLPPRFRFAYLPRQRKGEEARESCRVIRPPRFSVRPSFSRASSNELGLRTDGRTGVRHFSQGWKDVWPRGVLSGSSMRLARTLLFTPTEMRAEAGRKKEVTRRASGGEGTAGNAPLKRDDIALRRRESPPGPFS